MSLKTELSKLKSQGSHLTLANRAELSCSLAKTFEKTGDYDSAYEALSEFWAEPDKPPRVEGLEALTKADMFLRAGALAGWRGGAEAEGDQEIAKDLITRSLTIYERLGVADRQAEAHGELGLCYWREGGYDESRVQLKTALQLLAGDNDELRAVLLIRAAIVEADSHRFEKALRLYNEALPLIERTQDHALRGSFHVNYGLLLRRLATPEDREQYIDRALIEYAAASFHFEQAGNTRAQARVEANLGYLFFTIDRYADAHTHLNRAHYLFLDLKDVGNAAKVNDTRARTLLAQDQMIEAERIARAAVRTLQRGGEQAVLAEALTTHGTALARLGNYLRSRTVLERAVEIAQTSGDLEGAGRAQLSIIEELRDKTPLRELISIYRSAIELLKHSQDPPTYKRLISCAETLLAELGASETENQKSPDQTWEGFSFKEYVHESERAVIQRALRDAGGLVTDAAHLLGFKHHQSLIYLINTRHKDLLKTRSAVRKRRSHRFSQPRKTTKKAVTVPPQTDQLSVLHVEDHELVARTVADTLSSEGMQVDSCSNGTTALKILKGDKRYDVIILDNSLPGISGLELITRLRSIASRRKTPVIMLSGDDVEREAWRAGVDEFLLKPEAINQLPSAISRLLKSQKERVD